jgi:hypothetical protein
VLARCALSTRASQQEERKLPQGLLSVTSLTPLQGNMSHRKPIKKRPQLTLRHNTRTYAAVRLLQHSKQWNAVALATSDCSQAAHAASTANQVTYAFWPTHTPYRPAVVHPHTQSIPIISKQSKKNKAKQHARWRLTARTRRATKHQESDDNCTAEQGGHSLAAAKALWRQQLCQVSLSVQPESSQSCV